MCESVIELVQLTKRYGHFTSVDRLDLKIHKGEIFGLLGPNGAGKSTTILMMLGLTDPTSGTVHVCGTNSTTYPVEVSRQDKTVCDVYTVTSCESRDGFGFAAHTGNNRCYCWISNNSQLWQSKVRKEDYQQ